MEGPIAQFWLERTPDKREVGSSSLPRPTSSLSRAGPASTKPTVLSGVGEVGELAQLGERLPCTQEVTGSNPVFSTSCSRWKQNGQPKR